MLGLTKQGHNPPTNRRGDSSARSRTLEKGLQSTTDLKASINAPPLNAAGQPIVLNDVISFDGDFECANIEQVRRRNQTTFDVFMRNDSNGNSNLQWFYFRMKNTGEFADTIRINIVNFTKANSLFISVSDLSLYHSSSDPEEKDNFSVEQYSTCEGLF